jgi:ubiquinone/menaquinone biosynthesis C-methylase UbiE
MRGEKEGTMSDERRFSGRLSEQYDKLKLAYPDFDTLQTRVAEAVSRLRAGAAEAGAGGSAPDAHRGAAAGRALDIGAGSGFTSRAVLDAVPELSVIALDNEPAMIEQLRGTMSEPIDEGRLEPVTEDANTYIERQPDDSFEVIFSAFTLHNFTVEYRESLLEECLRVLAPGGIFVNADKYAPEGQEQFDALITQLNRFFDAFLPIGEYELLRDWVVHNVADQGPDRCQAAEDALELMEQLGFTDVALTGRSNMQALVTARKPPE